jgi:hypothetical protein
VAERVVGWLLALAVFMAPAVARAIEHEIFVQIEDEDDLYELLANEQISEETFAQLLDLLRRGTDLDTATRDELYALPNLTYDDVDAILAYREQAGAIVDPAQLVAAGVLSRRELRALAPFLVAPPRARGAPTGFVRYRTVWTLEDRRVPPMALQARVSALHHFTVGAAALLDRDRLAPVTWDPNRDAFVTDGPRVRPRAPKYFAQWETPTWGVIVGTYAIGFGQRLVFDTTGRATPNGFVLDDTIVRETELALQCRQSTGELTDTPCPHDAPRIYVTPDYTTRERLHGAAIGAKQIAMPRGWLQAHAFASVQRKSVYQYEVWNQGVCADPRVSGEVDPACSAPAVYRPGADPLAPAPAISYATLPNMVREIVGGGNIGYWHDARSHVGITGYGATADWLVKGVSLSFQDSARTPFGGPWGAVGADAAWGRAWADVFVELAHSFDTMRDGGGGPAAIVRHAASWKGHDLELSGRYYDGKFANPFARSTSAADEHDGLRARDEAGGRLRYNARLGEIVGVRSLLDAWTELGRPTPKLTAFARIDVQALPWLRPGAWGQYQSRDLRSHARGGCFDQGLEVEHADTFGVSASALEGVATECAGERVLVGGALHFDPHERVGFDVQYRHDFTDDPQYGDRMRQGAMVGLLFAAHPIDPLRLRLRMRWDDDDLHSDLRLQETLWGWLEIGARVRAWFQPSLRYDVRAWLDDRESTVLRRPNPEHWLHLQLEAEF